MIQGIFPAITDKSGHHSKDVIIRYAVFPVDTVIPKDNIVIRTHLDDAVKNILIRRTPVKNHIPRPAAFPALLPDGKQILPLTQ